MTLSVGVVCSQTVATDVVVPYVAPMKLISRISYFDQLLRIVVIGGDLADAKILAQLDANFREIVQLAGEWALIGCRK